MGKWVPDSSLDVQLIEIALADIIAVCSSQPADYYQACWPDIWEADTVVVEGDIVHPPTPNGFVYECTIGGTTGSSEPGWSEVPDAEFSDNTVTWKTHQNYSIAISALDPGDKVIDDAVDPLTGRSLITAAKSGVLVHVGGTVGHTALIRSSDKTLKLVTTAETDIVGINTVESGRTITINSLTVNSPDIA